MITKDLKIGKKEQASFDPLPENMYQVQLVDVNSESRPTYETRNAPEEEKVMEDVLNFEFAVLNDTGEQETLRGRRVWINFVPTFLYVSSKNGKNKLYKIIESLIGDELTPEQEASMDKDFINNLVGKQCRLATENMVKGDKVFTNVKSYYPVEVQMDPIDESDGNAADDGLDGISF